MRKSLTFGVMPSNNEFVAAFRACCGVDNPAYPAFSYELKGLDAESAELADVPTCGSFSAGELYSTIEKLIEVWESDGGEYGERRQDDPRENCGSVASSIMQVLGFEWI